MAFGFGFGMPRSFAVPAFSPLSLFASGAPGAWYDPSDYGATGTLFQDSAGTTAVTGVEQPVGLMLDKSQGLVLGPDLILNATNWLNPTNGIAQYWRKDGSQDAIGSVVDGTANGFSGNVQRYENSAGGTYRVLAVDQNLPIGSVGTTSYYLLSFKYRSNYPVTSAYGGGFAMNAPPNTGPAKEFRVLWTFSGVDNINRIRFRIGNYESDGFLELDDVSYRKLPGNHAFQATSASRPVLSARVNKLLATATLATQSVTTRATAHTLRFEGAGTVTLTGTAIGVYTAGTHSITTTAGTLTLTVVGSVTSADLRETNDGGGLPVYQAVVTSTNYATTGFLPYLKFDGVDDSLSTNSINFTSTDKMSVFAGVRKIATGTFGIIAELSATIDSNNGSFVLLGPNGTLPDYGFVSKGTIATEVVGNDYESPITNTLTGLGNISGDSTILRINGAQVGATTSDQGTGNYGNYPLYIGRRAGSSLPFNGQIYSMIIVGKAVTATELSSTETYVATKTGVTLA